MNLWRFGQRSRFLERDGEGIAQRAHLPGAQRELIGTYVPSNTIAVPPDDSRSHGGAVSRGDEESVRSLKRDYPNAAISPKLKALLHIAEKLQQSGKGVTAEDIERARKQGATDLEINDTV